MLRSFTTAILTLFTLVTHSAQNTDALQIFTENFPPYNYSENNTVTGINAQFVKEVCEDANLDCQFTVLPWKRAMRMASQTLPSGLISAARTQEREDLFKWVGPLSSGKNCVYRLTKRDDIMINTKADLPHYTLGTANDSAYLGLLDALGFVQGKNLFLFPGVYGLVKPFAAKRIDLIIGSSTTLSKQLAKGNLQISDVTPVLVLQDATNLANYMALHPQTDTQLVERLQTSLQALKSAGRLAEIEQQFVSLKSTENPRNIAPHLWDTCMSKPQ